MKFGLLAVLADDDALPKTDILIVKRHVRFTPKADIDRRL